MTRKFFLNLAPYALVALLAACGSGSSTPSSNNNESNSNSNESSSTTSATQTYVYTSNEDGTISAYSVVNTGESINVNTLATMPTNNGSDAGDLTFDPSGRFAYLPSFTNKMLSQFSINTQTGALTTINSPVLTPELPRYPVFSKSGTCLFISNFGTQEKSSITSYHINQTNGILSPAEKIENVKQPEQIVLSQDGQFAYVPNFSEEEYSTVNMYQVDESACNLLPLNPASISTKTPVSNGKDPWAVSISPDGNYLYASNLYTKRGNSDIIQYSINKTTGQLSYLPESAVILNGHFPGRVKFDTSGKFAYVRVKSMLDHETGKILMFSINNGQLVALPKHELELGKGLTFSSPVVLNAKANVFYITHNNIIGVYKVNTDGTLSEIANITLPNSKDNSESYIKFITVDTLGQYLYVLNPWDHGIYIYTINQSNGELNLASGPLLNQSHTPYDFTLYQVPAAN